MTAASRSPPRGAPPSSCASPGPRSHPVSSAPSAASMHSLGMPGGTRCSSASMVITPRARESARYSPVSRGERRGFSSTALAPARSVPQNAVGNADTLGRRRPSRPPPIPRPASASAKSRTRLSSSKYVAGASPASAMRSGAERAVAASRVSSGCVIGLGKCGSAGMRGRRANLPFGVPNARREPFLHTPGARRAMCLT